MTRVLRETGKDRRHFSSRESGGDRRRERVLNRDTRSDNLKKHLEGKLDMGRKQRQAAYRRNQQTERRRPRRD